MISSTKAGHLLGWLEGAPSQSSRLLNELPNSLIVRKTCVKLALIQVAVVAVVLHGLHGAGLP